MIENSISKLEKNFRIKVEVFMTVVMKKYKNLSPFETLRTLTRQKWLFDNHKSWTMNSYHLKWKAVDWVFLNFKWQPTWKWDYTYLHYVWWFCWITRIKQESCHLQDDWKSIEVVMKKNSALWKVSPPAQQKLLADINAQFRKYGYT